MASQDDGTPIEPSPSYGASKPAYNIKQAEQAKAEEKKKQDIPVSDENGPTPVDENDDVNIEASVASSSSSERTRPIGSVIPDSRASDSSSDISYVPSTPAPKRPVVAPSEPRPDYDQLWMLEFPDDKRQELVRDIYSFVDLKTAWDTFLRQNEIPAEAQERLFQYAKYVDWEHRKNPLDKPPASILELKVYQPGLGQVFVPSPGGARNFLPRPYTIQELSRKFRQEALKGRVQNLADLLPANSAPAPQPIIQPTQPPLVVLPTPATQPSPVLPTPPPPPPVPASSSSSGDRGGGDSKEPLLYPKIVDDQQVKERAYISQLLRNLEPISEAKWTELMITNTFDEKWRPSMFPEPDGLGHLKAYVMYNYQMAMVFRHKERKYYEEMQVTRDELKKIITTRMAKLARGVFAATNVADVFDAQREVFLQDITVAQLHEKWLVTNKETIAQLNKVINDQKVALEDQKASQARELEAADANFALLKDQYDTQSEALKVSYDGDIRDYDQKLRAETKKHEDDLTEIDTSISGVFDKLRESNIEFKYNERKTTDKQQRRLLFINALGGQVKGMNDVLVQSQERIRLLDLEVKHLQNLQASAPSSTVIDDLTKQISELKAQLITANESKEAALSREEKISSENVAMLAKLNELKQLNERLQKEDAGSEIETFYRKKTVEDMAKFKKICDDIVEAANTKTEAAQAQVRALEEQLKSQEERIKLLKDTAPVLSGDSATVEKYKQQIIDLQVKLSDLNREKEYWRKLGDLNRQKEEWKIKAGRLGEENEAWKIKLRLVTQELEEAKRGHVNGGDSKRSDNNNENVDETKWMLRSDHDEEIEAFEENWNKAWSENSKFIDGLETEIRTLEGRNKVLSDAYNGLEEEFKRIDILRLDGLDTIFKQMNEIADLDVKLSKYRQAFLKRERQYRNRVFVYPHLPLPSPQASSSPSPPYPPAPSPPSPPGRLVSKADHIPHEMYLRMACLDHVIAGMILDSIKTSSPKLYSDIADVIRINKVSLGEALLTIKDDPAVAFVRSIIIDLFRKYHLQVEVDDTPWKVPKDKTSEPFYGDFVQSLYKSINNWYSNNLKSLFTLDPQVERWWMAKAIYSEKGADLSTFSSLSVRDLVGLYYTPGLSGMDNLALCWWVSNDPKTASFTAHLIDCYRRIVDENWTVI